MSVVLRSIAGSHLYGLSRPDSDLDYYEVRSDSEKFLYGKQRKATQSIVDGIDVTAVSLSHFMDLALSGSHQALDAMFSEKTEIDEITALRQSFRVGSAVLIPYSRIIRKFMEQAGPRKQKHAARIAYNLQEMLERQRFSPTLSPEKAAHVMEMSVLGPEAFEKEVLKIVPELL